LIHVVVLLDPLYAAGRVACVPNGTCTARQLGRGPAAVR
jgi:hypothetical protein